ncbi:MAG: short-chain dehydrogenase/reductase [Candidatus Nitrosopolaris wilkensis]|nr:MAG: short-chain dehydrogenase/reductase [Candidatus Nitrosopolaris wilkensis]
MVLSKGNDEGDRQKVAIVTGSASGIGYATSLMLARKGFYTYASVHNTNKSTSLESIANTERLPLKLIQLDVTDDSSVKHAVEKIVLEKGRIDVLVNNAGYGLFGAFEDLSLDEIKAQFEINFFGVVRVTQHVLPIIRTAQSGGGVIVNVSSVDGHIAFPVISAYCGTKFALEGLSESIAYELEPFGIKVILIEPGPISSNFMKGSVLAKRALDPQSPYAELVQKFNAKTSSQHENTTQPEEVAKTIIQAILDEKPEFRYVVGNYAVSLLEARKNMPYSEFQKMIIQNIMQ